MQQLINALGGNGWLSAEGAKPSIDAFANAKLALLNPTSDMSLTIGEGAVAEVALIQDQKDNVSISIRMERGARLNLTQVMEGSGKLNLSIEQGEESHSKIVAASLKADQAAYHINLCGRGAYSELYTLQMGSDSDINSVKIDMRHCVADTSSHSLSKCVAANRSSLNFDALVYVAPDAQRTSADQNCRSIELSDTAHIVAHPQLEIYADDVKCSHGATMGQVDNDAILYMRQRGLSESQARRLQVEGFVAEIAQRCTAEELCEKLQERVKTKLEEM